MSTLPQRVSIFTHDMDGTTSACAGLIDYFLNKKISSLIVCKFPFIRSNDGSIKVQTFLKGELIKEKKSLIKFYKPESISYLKDLFLGIIYGLKNCTNSDIFFGTPNILVLIGIFLRKIGLIKKVVFYQIDYTPVRYKNSLINNIYYLIDKYVCYRSDEVWALTKQMIVCKTKDRGWNIRKINYRTVPTGNNSDKLKKLKNSEPSGNRIIYYGGIYKNKGAELFIPIAQSLIKRNFKNFKIECIGGGEVENLRKEIKTNHLGKYFLVHGQIENQKTVEEIIQKGSIAIAPYFSEDKNNFSYFSDPGKVKMYLGCGLPVVITDVPPVAKDIIAAKKVGVVVKYHADDFARAIIRLLSDKQRLRQLKARTKKLGQEFSWENIFNKIFISSKYYEK